MNFNREDGQPGNSTDIRCGRHIPSLLESRLNAHLKERCFHETQVLPAITVAME